MKKISFRIPAGVAGVTKFASSAADELIGDTLTMLGRPSRIIEAEVIDDGDALWITVETDSQE